MGRDFIRISAELAESFDLSKGIGKEISSGITSARMHGPNGSYTNITDVFNNLQSISSSNTKYTIIETAPTSYSVEISRIFGSGGGTSSIDLGGGGGDSSVSGATVLDSPILASQVKSSVKKGSRTYTLDGQVPDSAKFVLFSCNISDSVHRKSGKIILEISNNGANKSTIQLDRGYSDQFGHSSLGHTVGILPRSNSYNIAWGGDSAFNVYLLGWI